MESIAAITMYSPSLVSLHVILQYHILLLTSGYEMKPETQRRKHQHKYAVGQMEREWKQLWKCPKSLFYKKSMHILYYNTPEDNCI